MKWIGRLLSIIGVLLILAGVFSGGFLVSASCFDTCPEGDLSVYTGIRVLGLLLPGLIVAGLGWVLCLRLLIQSERRWRTILALSILPICAIGSTVAILVNNAGHLFPVNEGDIFRWEESLTWVFILLPCWPLITVLSTLALPREVPAGSPRRRHSRHAPL